MSMPMVCKKLSLGIPRVFIALLFSALTCSMSIAAEPVARAPIRVSIKFILDANGNRPATGKLNTDIEILLELITGWQILQETGTEFTIDTVYFSDLPGASQWFDMDASFVDFLRMQILTIGKEQFAWHDSAINIYINGGQGSAQSSYPPANDIILMNQWCGNDPSCILHEMGHSMNLMHTHEPNDGGDECGDTLTDNKDWTRDQIAMNNFSGRIFAQLNPAEQDRVNLTYNNVMSYHTNEPQRRLSRCQKNRVSMQASADRGWLFAIDPIWVNNWNCFPGPDQNGSFLFPFCELNNLFNAVDDTWDPLDLTNRIIVLDGESQVDYVMSPRMIKANTGIISRNGPVRMRAPGARKYKLPVNLEHSADPAVANAIRKVQNEDTLARNATAEGKRAEELATTDKEKAAIRARTAARKKEHEDNALKHLLQAETHAKGDELLSIQLELAQRYRDAGFYHLAVPYFERVAAGTNQEGLRTESLNNAREFRKKLQGGNEQPLE